ncbi:hypothetical protein Ahy_A06g027271 isoform B [Arachis hypogaea]|uniref:Uncharacterized protein n=1 Tax=Arachis hypogaea TaxID=3818 RepID=A0A445CN50_ARAHY|nr:hypothetical protein Ahy_A06g027271 isoform B [Arachis hypogaea]
MVILSVQPLPPFIIAVHFWYGILQLLSLPGVSAATAVTGLTTAAPTASLSSPSSPSLCSPEAREEAWDKVSILELEINAAMRDLDFERRRLRGAKERLMLWETQLRAFYSITEEMQVLFAKQQEQLNAMQSTLENEENYENTCVDMDGVIGGTPGRERRSTASTLKRNRDQVETSSNEPSVTEKHDCENAKIHEFTSADHDHDVRGGFGYDINGAGTIAMMDGGTGGTEDPHYKARRNEEDDTSTEEDYTYD